MHHDTERVALTRAGVDALFADRVGNGITPSTIYAVFTPQGISYANGFGDIGSGREPTVDTSYRIASCTKSFTAAALLIMVERGLVSLDDPITRYVGIGPLVGPGGHQVDPPTIRQLVTMSAGLPNDDPWADRQESLSRDQFAAMLAPGIRFTARPGERFEYSNLGFALLGRVIEQVSGRDYVPVVTEELIRPLGLDGIGYDTAVAAPDGYAIGQRKIDGAWTPLPFSGPGAFSAIGGIFATPRALARWASWLAAAFTDADDHGQPLGRLSRRLMQTIQTPIPSGPGGSDGYGMGLVVEESDRHGTVIGHSGGYPGFGAHMRWHAASGIGVLGLENGTYSQPSAPVTAALRTILDEVIIPDSEPELWPETAAARLSFERLLRNWDDQLADGLFADNVELDDSLDRRRTEWAGLVADVDLSEDPLPLINSAPASQTPAQLTWTIPGRNGSLRCEIALTPQQPPRVQTVRVTPG
ncbi:MAG: beta-lactamase family protein [Microlunatus sp.]|nr:beta-lactamase family protein [Microlunatus sp.]